MGTGKFNTSKYGKTFEQIHDNIKYFSIIYFYIDKKQYIKIQHTNIIPNDLLRYFMISMGRLKTSKRELNLILRMTNWGSAKSQLNETRLSKIFSRL